MFDKRQLLRIVKDKDGNVSLDLTGKKAGRGAYICKELECFKKMRKTKSLEKTLDIGISEEIYNLLEMELQDDK